MRYGNHVMSRVARPLAKQILMSDLARFPNWRTGAARLVKGDALILRDYNHPARAQIAHEMAKFCAINHLYFSVADDWHLAWKLKAGLHLPEYQTRRTPTPRYRQNQMLTIAVHNIAALHRAAKRNPDGVIIAPVFESPGKKPLGVLRFQQLAQIARTYNITPYALGGMSPHRAHRLHHIHFAAIRIFYNPFTST